MSRKQSYDADLSMSARLNYPEKLASESYLSKKYSTNFDRFISPHIDLKASQETNYSSSAINFSSIRKLPENISNIRETFSFNPVESAKDATESTETEKTTNHSRLDQLINQAINLKASKQKQHPKSDQAILSASVNFGSDTYPKSQTQISQKSYSTIDDRKPFPYPQNLQLKSIRSISKKSIFEKSQSANVQQEIRKIRQQNIQRKNNIRRQSDEEISSPYLKNYSVISDAKDSFSKKNYFEYYSPKVQKSNYLKGTHEFNTLSPPYERRKKQTSFEEKCESPKVSSQSQSNKLTNSSNKASSSSRGFQFLNDKVKIQDFQIGKKLGQGRFGIAYLAIHKSTSGIFAIKKVKKQTIIANELVDQFALEVKLQTYLTHPFIVKIYGILDDEEHIYLIMEYLPQGTLFNYFKNSKNRKLTESDAAEKVRYLAESIKYLQDRGIAHRDIKPQNIIMTNGVCKLADFGWATFCDEERRKTYCGTCDYVAPQILHGETYDQTVDLWCIGVLAFELVTGKTPFYHMSQKQTKNKIMNVNVTYPEDLSENFKSFLTGLIQKNPDERMTIEEVLAHSFIKDVKLGE